MQARTLEFYRQVGLADSVIARGREVSAANLWVSGRRVARAVFGPIGKGISPYPYAFIFPQDEHERLLIDRLTTLESGSSGRLPSSRSNATTASSRGWRAQAATSTSGSRVRRRLRRRSLACPRSIVIGFAGGTSKHLFYVADVEAHGSAMNGDIHVALDRTDFLAVFPLTDAHRARLVGTVRPEAEAARRESLTWDDVSTRVIEWMRIDVERVNWFSTYHVRHRVADRFRSGRAFLLGDAAHSIALSADRA